MKANVIPTPESFARRLDLEPVPIDPYGRLRISESPVLLSQSDSPIDMSEGTPLMKERVKVQLYRERKRLRQPRHETRARNSVWIDSR